MTTCTAADPRECLGIYKSYDDVPARRRLGQYAARYADEDLWSKYLDATGLYEEATERTRANNRCALASWQEHMATADGGAGRHYALARPQDVETWCQQLLSRVTAQTAYTVYWCKIKGFYDWLLWHAEHPHVYHPFLMAAAEYHDGAAGRIWECKIARQRDSELSR